MNPRLINRRRILQASVAIACAAAPYQASVGGYPPFKAYRNPGCGCCEKWAERMKQAGFEITMTDDPALDERRAAMRLPAALAGCHIAMLGDYVIEGHVPPEDILTFLSAKPAARGLAVPGMPMGSPGMESGETADPYDVLIFAADGSSKVYASH